MPTEDDGYGRRQVTLQHASASPAPAQCPAGCSAASNDHSAASERFSNERIVQQDRYGSDKQISERFEPPERFQTAQINDRFGSERSNSDRLPSGERYHGVSERYPLGDRPPTVSVSSDRLQAQNGQPFQPERYHYAERCQRYQDRYSNPQNMGSLDRYHVVERYSRTNTPTERCSSSNADRYPSDYNPDRYTPTERHKFNQDDLGSKTLPSEVYKIRDRSSERKQSYDRYQSQFSEYERYPSERFLPIPCPERFSTQEQRNEMPDRVQFSQVPYLEPPSPAPANDRFIPPPPLSPTNTPSPECYSANAFPSPTAANPTPERFIPPPPLSPSPTENFSPKKLERYDKRERYYSQSPNPSDRYMYDRVKDRYYNDRYVNQNYNDRFSNTTERYVPPHAHVPVERYVPQQQENYYGNTYQPYDRYQKFNANDPYMRRDLSYHYRLPVPYPQNQYQRIRYISTSARAKCCQFQEHFITKSSPGSSSSSSVTSQGKDLQASNQELQCQNYHAYPQHQHQEKGIQCTGYHSKDVHCIGFHVTAGKDGSSPSVRKGQCRHGVCSSSVEYVGQSGGRHVCATPPPRGSVSSGEITVCGDQCCTKRGQNTLALTVWRTSPSQQQPTQQQQQPTQQQQQTQAQSSPAQLAKSPTPNVDQGDSQTQNDPTQSLQPQQPAAILKPPPIQRAISLPAPAVLERYRTESARIHYSQSERGDRPRLARSTSRKEVIKNYIKKETANFFGVDEEKESEQQQRWLDRRKRLASRTYGPLKDGYQMHHEGTIRSTTSEIDGAVQQHLGQLQRSDRPDVLPGPSDVPDTPSERLSGTRVKRKDSVAKMTWDGLAYVVTTLTRHQPRARTQTDQWSRSYPEEPVPEVPAPDERVFFERPRRSLSPASIQAAEIERIDEADALKPIESPTRVAYIPRSTGWRRHPHTPPGAEETRQDIGCNRIFTRLLDRVLDNSDRRQYGMGWVGRMFGRSTRRSVMQDASIQEQLDDMEDYRPMFTYWVTCVQILVLLISLICYGWGSFGLDMHARSSQVLVTSLSLQQVDYMEPANFWLGPRAADLIHLGAKFAPCMRVDNKILQEIEKRRAKERETACCIRNDDSGCVQSSQADCSKTISTWKKWSAGDSGPGGRISGSVCGLDPKFCDAPASVHPYEWPDDITKWPICRKKTNSRSSTLKNRNAKDKIAEHMVCEVIGHPCCIGIHGQCKITTKEYCDFVRGTFHEEASLCSQVSCLNDVCGMIPFYMPDTPDQFYRLWTSLFLHAGVLQLIITVLIQFFLMKDLEKLTGGLRIGIIYIGSGVAGNLASAIFVPYRADVGPAGSQFGLLACLIVEVLNAWPMLKHPKQALGKLLSVTFVLFMVGLLPWVDNYAHLFGFVFGFLLSYALLPFVSFGPYDRQKKVVLIWVCLLSAAFLFICLVLLFYIIPVYDCKICSYFNCLPLTDDFCASQNINFKREEPIV